uniref:Uncharacterized protein n=1 Tax=Acrobeloides nanus TaxID=290746 RepID=A0A914D1Q1_9BILA
MAIATLVSDKTKQLAAGLGGLSLLISTFLLIVIVVYAAKYNDQHGGSIKLGYSYWLAVTAFVFMIISAALGFAMMGAGKGEDEDGFPTARA